MGMLKREADLQELVRLVGMDSLSPTDRLLLEAARMVREDFLHQNAFDDIDTYTSMIKQSHMLDIIMDFYHRASDALGKGVDLDNMLNLPVREDISRAKLIEENNLSTFDQLRTKIKDQFNDLLTEIKSS
jgi:V/A-type H+-transporting ATPase subunit A